jgi:hypothetical protein
MYPGAESSLAKLIEDPLVGMIMKSDGVDRRSIELLFERIAAGRSAGVEVVRMGSRRTEG